MEYPKPESQWRNPRNDVISTVESVVNTEPDAKLPPLVIYTDNTGVRAAHFVQSFLAENQPYDPKSGIPSAVEIMLPAYSVHFGAIPQKPVGLHYFIDADYAATKDCAAAEIRSVIDQVFVQSAIVPGGVKRPPILQPNTTIKFVDRVPKIKSQELRDACEDAGVNYVGLVKGAPAIWGVRTADGALTSSWILLASCLRHAFRCVTFLYSDQLAAQRWVEQFTTAWNHLQHLGYAREHEAFGSHIIDERIHIVLSSHWFRADPNRQMVIQIPINGEQAGQAQIPYDMLRQLQAMYDMTKIIGGVA